MNSYNFTQMKNIGKWAVDTLVAKWAKDGFFVTNVEADRFYQTLDIDLIVLRDGVKRYVEVKGDRYLSGNIYIETIANYEKNEPGCLVYTGADWIAYYLVKKGECLMIPVPALKHWIPGNIDRFEQKAVRSHFDSGNTFTSRGHPVPVSVILEEVEGTYLIKSLPVMGDN